jgi:predicted branched-subunit amino acid permease
MEPTEKAAPPIVPRPRRWLAPLFFLVGAGLLPWTIYLVVTLPGRHVQSGYYDVAWGGFDVALAALFVSTGIGLVRRTLWVQSTATAVATLLVCDAWFDILSSRPGRERLLAVALALVAELPSAVVCLLITRHVEETAERAQEYALVARRLRPRRRRAAAAPGTGA